MPENKPAPLAPDSLLAEAIERFTAIGRLDPRRVFWQGEQVPYQLGEAACLQHYIDKLTDAPSLALRLAAHCQHLRRFAYPRDAFAAGREGYLAWRIDAARRSAAEAGEVLAQLGSPIDVVEQVTRIITKQDRRHNTDVQLMQDALALAFLKLEAEAFFAKHTEPEIIRILQRTLQKTSDLGKAVAIAEPWTDSVRAWLAKAVR